MQDEITAVNRLKTLNSSNIGEQLRCTKNRLNTPEVCRASCTVGRVVYVRIGQHI